MADRRIINKPAHKPTVEGAENIMIKPKGMEERMKDVEAYLQQTDPILRTVVSDINLVKGTITSLNDEITKIAGVQSRTNSYLDGKLAEINATFGAIVSVVKKIDDDYQALFTEDSGEQGQEQMEEPIDEQPAEGEYSDDDLLENDEPIEEPPKVINVKPVPKVEKPVPKQPDKKKK